MYLISRSFREVSAWSLVSLRLSTSGRVFSLDSFLGKQTVPDFLRDSVHFVRYHRQLLAVVSPFAVESDFLRGKETRDAFPFLFPG